MPRGRLIGIIRYMTIFFFIIYMYNLWEPYVLTSFERPTTKKEIQHTVPCSNTKATVHKKVNMPANQHFISQYKYKLHMCTLYSKEFQFGFFESKMNSNILCDSQSK